MKIEIKYILSPDRLEEDSCMNSSAVPVTEERNESFIL